MYTATRTVIETIKTFFLSFLCSAPLTLALYQSDSATGVLFNSFVCFILNLTAFVVFLFLYYKNWSKTFERSFTFSEYMVPALISFATYLFLSSFLYIVSGFPEFFPGLEKNPWMLEVIRNIYRYIFQHARFLEPMLNSEYAFVSIVVSQLLTFGSLIAIPVMAINQK